MSLRLEGKTRAEYAEDTIHNREVMAQITATLAAAELGKRRQPLDEMAAPQKARIIAHAVQFAFAIARAVVAEDIRRYGQKIDHA